MDGLVTLKKTRRLTSPFSYWGVLLLHFAKKLYREDR
jgi:hypothetical protein